MLYLACSPTTRHSLLMLWQVMLRVQVVVARAKAGEVLDGAATLSHRKDTGPGCMANGGSADAVALMGSGLWVTPIVQWVRSTPSNVSFDSQEDGESQGG